MISITHGRISLEVCQAIRKLPAHPNKYLRNSDQEAKSDPAPAIQRYSKNK